jgi:hypothetical protein
MSSSYQFTSARYPHPAGRDRDVNISVYGDVLPAECCKIEGECLPSDITLNGIENIDGVLIYTGDP